MQEHNGDNPNKIIKRQMSIRLGDWERMKEVGKNAPFPAERSTVSPRIISLGLDQAEKEQRENKA